jgi:hypothetical protein
VLDPRQCRRSVLSGHVDALHVIPSNLRQILVLDLLLMLTALATLDAIESPRSRRSHSSSHRPPTVHALQPVPYTQPGDTLTVCYKVVADAGQQLARAPT